jgi:preprotein translocase subunit SecE
MNMPPEDLKPKGDDDPDGTPVEGGIEPTAPLALDDEAPADSALAPGTLDDGTSRALAPSPAESRGEDESRDDVGDEVVVPTQLGTQRFVYAAYFAAGIAIAFMLSKAISYAWLRLATYKPQFGEPHDEIVMPIAAVIGALTAVYYYRDLKTRTLAEEVASELGKVSWPGREEVVNSTFVVIVTTLLATTFFALMDRFWGFVTNLVYGA